MPTAETSTIERFVQALGARDTTSALELYRPGAVFEPHVPGWDGLTDDREEIGALLFDFFTSRDGFRVVDRQIISQGDIVALRFDLRWKDAESGEPCLCFQSHFFELEDDQILLHRMYCAGVRVLERADAELAVERRIP